MIGGRCVHTRSHADAGDDQRSSERCRGTHDELSDTTGSASPPTRAGEANASGLPAQPF